MTSYAALLRAINVGGTGKLPMRELVQICEEAGFSDARTFIQSGNVVLNSKLSEAKIKAKLEPALAEKLGKPVAVLVRSAQELAAALDANPFPKEPPNRVMIVFLDDAPPRSVLKGLVAPGGERVELRGRDVYVHYPNGAGSSKLKLAFAKAGTARNLNTVRKLVELLA